MISTYASAISLLQNNCTFLNEIRVKMERWRDTDFCALTSFNPEHLAFALRFVNFTGYTGNVSFSQDILLRKGKMSSRHIYIFTYYCTFEHSLV